jgi:hypothetical protein
VSSVVEVIEPFARQLTEAGRAPGGRRVILKHIGNALLVQHRVSGCIAVAEKPDAIGERGPILFIKVEILFTRTSVSQRSEDGLLVKGHSPLSVASDVQGATQRLGRFLLVIPPGHRAIAQ